MSHDPVLNPHVLNLKESATLAINLEARAARKRGEDVCHFGFGQSPFPIHPKIQIALANNAHQKDYLPTLGLPALRTAIKDFHKQFFGYNFDDDLILVGPGSKELIFQLLYVLQGPVFVPAPSWVSYGPQVNLRGNRIVDIQTSRDNSYKLQASELEEALKKSGEKQNILILNNPCNPTGAMYCEEEIRPLADVCRKYNVIVISDEIYSLINFTDRKYSSLHEFYPEGTFITGGLSKSHAAGGYRMGFLAAPETHKLTIKTLCAMVSETFSAVSAPIQYAACEAYCGDYDLMRYVRQCTHIHKAVGEYMQERFVKAGLNCPKPEGAFYLFPDFNNHRDALAKKGLKTSDQLARHLVEEIKVAVLPGSDFYREESDLSLRVATVDYDGEQVYLESLAPLLDPKVKEHSLGHEFVEKNCPSIKKGCDRIADFIANL